MSLRRQEQTLVADQAAEWTLRLKLEGSQAHDALLEWLRESPLHVQEFLLACGIDDSMTRLDPNHIVDVDVLIARAHSKSKVIPLADRLPLFRQRVGIQVTRGRRLWLAASGVAAAAALAMLTWFTYLSPGSQGVYATEIGDQRTFKLHDGSVVVLNTGSRIRVAYTDTARDIHLDRGQALFQVYHDATRPFRVHVASTVVQAIGTQFDVRRFADRTTVAVVEGTVQVSTGDRQDSPQPATAGAAREPLRINVGESTTVNSAGAIAPPERINPDLATAWRRQRVVFVDTSLDDIATEFNRYNVSPHLRIEGDELKTRVFSGSFNAYSPESFLTYLSQETDLAAERRGDEVVIRPR